MSRHDRRDVVQQYADGGDPQPDSERDCIVCGSDAPYGFSWWMDDDEHIVQEQILRESAYIGFENGPFCSLACVNERLEAERELGDG